MDERGLCEMGGIAPSDNDLLLFLSADILPYYIDHSIYKPRANQDQTVHSFALYLSI